MKSDLEILQEAREILETRGWIQRDLYRSDSPNVPGGFCLRGALLKASGWQECTYEDPDGWQDFPEELYEPVDWVCDQLSDKFLGLFSVPYWNDHVAKTKTDVLELLDKAISARKEPK